jgi:hypothetical protein
MATPFSLPPSKNTHTIVIHLNEIFLMNNTDVASWNTGIVIYSSISSVLSSDHGLLKRQANQVRGTKNGLLKDFKKEESSYHTNYE